MGEGGGLIEQGRTTVSLKRMDAPGTEVRETTRSVSDPGQAEIGGNGCHGEGAAREIEIPTVHVCGLQERLGFKEPLDFPMSSLCRPLTTWQMARDDAPILRYLYRGFRPERHLEFGTWEGFGTLLCLEESEATVWTMNLQDGETYPDGSRCYPRSLGGAVLPEGRRAEQHPDGSFPHGTDSLGFIGRFYLEKGYGSRVCQIYCDSREWDTRYYAPGFFDTVLIDGGHTPEVVRSDTKKAMPLVRSGGLIIWHDFCPPVADQFRSTCGVQGAILSERESLRVQMRDLFWIYPSWILLGVRK